MQNYYSDINRCNIACSKKKRDKEYIKPNEWFCLLLILHFLSCMMERNVVF